MSGPRNIILTGFMGTGKSTVGRLLAARLAMKHLDTDAMIERRHGPIPRIFDQLGEAGFREIERNIAIEIAADEGYVFSTGGRFMLDEHNAELLVQNNRVFCLNAELDVIMRRVLKRRSARPLLIGPNPRARVQALLAERSAAYGVFEQVPTNDDPPMTVVDDIIQRLEAAGSKWRAARPQD